MADLQAGVGAVALALEAVHDSPKFLAELDAPLDKRISDSGRAEKVSYHTYRLTFQDAVPQAYSGAFLDTPSVNFPTPGSSDWQQGTMTPVAAMLGVGWTILADIAGKPEQTVLNVVAKQMADSIKVMAQRRDINLAAGDGTGFLGNITAVDTVNLILAFNDNDYGARLIKKGMIFDIYNGTAFVTTVTCLAVSDPSSVTQTVTVGSTLAGVAAGYIARVTQLTSGAPVFTYGIPYWNSNTPAGLTVGIDRSQAANNFILANGLNAASSSVTAPMLRIPFDQIRGAQGVEAVKNGGLFIHTSMGQKAQYEQIAGGMAIVPLNNGKAGSFDALFREFSVNGIEIVENIHAHMQRWDYLSPKTWGKIKWGEGMFWYESEGRRVFQQIGTNGQPTAGIASFLIDTIQYYVDNPKAQAALYNCQQPTGY